MRACIALVLVGCAIPDPVDETAIEQTTQVCARGDVVHGMDVSSYETSIDWAMAKASGIEFAFIRVSDGLTFHDKKFPAYWAGAQQAGVLRGAYQFFRPAEDPIAQADLLLSAIGTRQPGDLPPVIDVETTGGLAPADVEAAVRAWVDHVTAAIGRPPIIYAGFYSWQDYTGSANLTREPLWHAQYTTAACPNIPVPWTDWMFWQHSSTGTVPGVLGEQSDLDVFNGTRAELEAFAASAPAPCGTIGRDGGEIDDTDACFSAGGPATTLRRVPDAGERSGLVWTHATTSPRAGNFAQWTLSLAEAGTYRVEAYTDARYAQSQHAKYVVRAAGATTTVELDQSAADGWQSLGELSFAAGDDQYVYLADNTGEAGCVVQLVFDAIRLVRVDGSEPPPPDDEPPGHDGGCSTGGGAGLGLVMLLAGLARRRR